jgi:phospholipid/cholesterol/gamma-HCH transport system ATP-binding protein
MMPQPATPDPRLESRLQQVTGQSPPAAAGAPAAATAARPSASSGATAARTNGQKHYVHDPNRPTAEKTFVIEARELKKHFGRQKVLDGVTFGIPQHEITMIMGPSGTGKSVFLRHVVGLIFPDSGDIIVDGKSVPTLSSEQLLDLRQDIGMLFQDGALFSSMNLYDNVAFPLRQHTRRGEGEVREVVMARLTEVGLAGADKKFPNELSGGMRKRAGFARALVLQPKILLFDEPDSGLDPVRTALLSELIREISERYDCTSIIISHDVNTVRRVADNIAVLYNGKCVAFGSQKEIHENQDPFIQQFLNGAAQGPLGMD